MYTTWCCQFCFEMLGRLILYDIQIVRDSSLATTTCNPFVGVYLFILPWNLKYYQQFHILKTLAKRDPLMGVYYPI